MANYPSSARAPLLPAFGVEAFGEPAVNWSQHLEGILAFALALPQSCQIGSTCAARFQSATHHPLPASENATMTTSLLAAWCEPGQLHSAHRPAITRVALQ